MSRYKDLWSLIFQIWYQKLFLFIHLISKDYIFHASQKTCLLEKYKNFNFWSILSWQFESCAAKFFRIFSSFLVSFSQPKWLSIVNEVSKPFKFRLSVTTHPIEFLDCSTWRISLTPHTLWLSKGKKKLGAKTAQK